MLKNIYFTAVKMFAIFMAFTFPFITLWPDVFWLDPVPELRCDGFTQLDAQSSISYVLTNVVSAWIVFLLLGVVFLFFSKIFGRILGVNDEDERWTTVIKSSKKYLFIGYAIGIPLGLMVHFALQPTHYTGSTKGDCYNRTGHQYTTSESLRPQIRDFLGVDHILGIDLNAPMPGSAKNKRTWEIDTSRW